MTAQNLSPAQADGFYVEGPAPTSYEVNGITITTMRQVFASEAACAEYHQMERLVALADDLAAAGLSSAATRARRRQVVAARERAAQLDWTPAMAFSG